MPRLEIPRPERVTLANGMVVMLLEDHELPLVAVTALLRTGSRLDPPAKLGLGALAGELLKTGGIARIAGGGGPRLAPGGPLSRGALDRPPGTHAAATEIPICAGSGRGHLSFPPQDLASLRAR